eukprot:CAMPEP_0206176814 /NCGR_PEP_ID=MMETSP1474-20131121/59255_1 /ASSEMBLY_ACC=CAM_ASM_001110 /TAXON_ID=97495 /ORGANISM="Imantonia sp., Strain RCC918" /LENGTH=72 /DNA_ID=CAMNT_0053588143 /DNA_START=21 /DNA_END=236 /DNA_ORIENTATION=+
MSRPVVVGNLGFPDAHAAAARGSRKSCSWSPSLLSLLPCSLHARAHRSVAHGRTLPWPHRVRDARRREGSVD